MIVSRTPLRISFLGGGTDYPGWFREHGGAVLSATINKYLWITLRRRPPFGHTDHLLHLREGNRGARAVVEACLECAGVEGLIEMTYQGDVEPRSGMGTSSAFTVGFLNACHALNGKRRTKRDLAEDAIHIEQWVLKETVGSQDQVAAAFGGLNHFIFGADHSTSAGPFSVSPVPLPPWRREEFHRHLLLFFTGISRTASQVAETFVPAIGVSPHLADAVARCEAGLSVLSDLGPIETFGEVLHEAWQRKRELSPAVSSPEIDALYTAARDAGAIGGKLLGAGGGGFMLFFARSRDHDAIKARLGLLHVPFKFETEGSSIVVYDP